MVSSIYTRIVIHMQTYNRHAYFFSQIYKLSYILLNFSNLGIWFLAMYMFFSYFQYIFEMGQVPEEVNGELILVV